MNIDTVKASNRISKINFSGETEPKETVEHYPQEKVGGFVPSIGAFTASQIATAGSLPIALGLIIPAMQKQGNLPESEIKTLKDAAEKVIKKSKLNSHNLIIKWTKPFKKAQSTKDIIMADLLDPVAAVKNGRNAFFITKDGILPSLKYGPVAVKKNTILMPENKITYAVFHELGHAMNANLSKFGKALQSCRSISMMLPTIIGLYGACTRKSKPNEEGNLTTKQKINNGIRNNAGKLAFIATLPMLAEEALATKKGLSYAKEILSPDLYKKVAKGNKVAFLSYLTTAIFASLGAWTAVKVKDKIIDIKEQRQEKLYKEALEA